MKTALRSFKKSTITYGLLFFTLLSQIHAQNTVLSSGGDINNTNGSISFSIGQTIQETLNNTDGSVIQGIQFYFDDTTLKVIDLENNVSISTYPNPTTSVLNVKLQDSNENLLSFSMYDLNGRLVKRGKLSNQLSKINIQNLEAAAYLLKIYNPKSQLIKTFKIIKN